MNEKEIKVSLTKNNLDKIVLEFDIEKETYEINLENNDSEAIKSVFMALAKELRIAPLKINYLVDEKKIDNNSDGLFIESATEYIRQLESEILKIENDSDLKIIREANKK